MLEDPVQFRRRISQISNEELLNALNNGPRTIETWAEYWNKENRHGLFRDADDLLASSEEATRSLAANRENILRAAERILQHDIQGWGDVSIQHGPIVDFNADYGRNGKYGFHYWFWARPLIQAFLLTCQQHYLAEFDALFNSWYEQREAVHGDIDTLDVIYYELGLGLRVRTFLEYYHLPFAARPLQTHARMLKIFLGAGRWLLENESTCYRAGNWQVMGCTGLAWIAALLPEFRESPAWASVATERLLEHVQRDLYSDGCHYERVPSSYMLSVYKDLRNVATLTRRRDLQSATDRMLEWYMRTLPSDGIIPAINDGGRVRMPIQLLDEGLKQFPQARNESAHLPASGFTALRGDNLYMLINHGPMAGGHTHHDALSFEMHARVTPMAIDSGIGKTYDDPLHESWYVTPAAHNMLAVVGANLDRAAAEGSDLVFAHSRMFDYFAATHRGYEQSAGVVHRRHVLFARREYFLLIDEIRNPSPVDVIWHLHSPLSIAPNTVNLSSPLVLQEREKGGAHIPALSVSWDQTEWTAQHSRAMACTAEISGYSDYEKITWLKIARSLSKGTTRIAVLLYPGAGAKLTRLTDGYWIVEHASGQDHLLLPDDKADLAGENFSFRGLCAMWRVRNDQVTHWAALRSTLLSVDNQILCERKSPVDVDGEPTC